MYSECLISMYEKINKNDNQKDYIENIQNRKKLMNEIGMNMNQKNPNVSWKACFFLFCF